MDIYVEQLHQQTWAIDAEILFMTHLLKTDICVFLNTTNNVQVNSGDLLQPELQILELRLHFEVVL